MLGNIQNRDAFLKKIANRLGRDWQITYSDKPEWSHHPQKDILKNLTQDELVHLLHKSCANIHTTFLSTTKESIRMDLLKAIQKYGGGPVITWKDERFQKWGIHAFMTNELPEQGIKVDEWNHSNGEVNIQIAEKANIGIVISEYTLAESGTIVIFSDKDKGRMVSFFPKHLIALIPKSSLVPRFTQAAEKLRERFKTMLDIPSSIHFISGPSNSADIELELVVGVHGPLKAAYIVINDL